MYRNVYFTGRAGSGKDTQAEILVKKHGYERVALADPVKEIASILLGLPTRELEARKKEFRPLLIAIGQGARQYRMWWVRFPLLPRYDRGKWLLDYLRKFLPADYDGRWMNPTFFDIMWFDFITKGWGRPDCWLKRAKLSIDEANTAGVPVVVTDCRMLNEAKYLRKLGFLGVRLYLSEDDAKERLFRRDGTTDFSFFQNETEIHANSLDVDYAADGWQSVDEIAKSVEWFLGLGKQ